nr:MAG TPA: hypothetical protein [Caudoviricetes sp.]
MEIEIINRKIKNKILVQQGSSEVNPVIFFVPKTDAGVDLSACKFFVSIVDGQGYDKIPVPFTEEGDTLQVQWDVESRTTAVSGNHPFQLLAENLEQEVVWLTNTSHVIVRESLHVDDPISGFLPSVLQAYQERMDQMEGDTGETLQKAQEFAEQAGKYAQQTAQDKEATAADRESVEEAQTELSEQMEAVQEELETAKGLVEQVGKDAQAAQEAAKSTASDKQAVTSTKTEIAGIQKEVDQQKQAVDKTVQTFTETTVPAAQQAVEEAGQAKVDEAKGYAENAGNSAQEAGESLSDMQEAVNNFNTVTLPEAIDSVESAGQEQISTLQEEGEKQLAAVQAQVELAERQAQQAKAAAEEAKQAANNLYGLLPTVTVSGQGVVTLSGCAAAPLRECTIHGAYAQEGTPTPEVPINPKFVGSGGTLSVSLTGSEPQTVTLSRPLMGSGDSVDLLSGQGKTTWTETELDGTESWLKSGKAAVGGTVFYATLSGQDTQSTTKEIISTHFHQAENLSALVPGDIWMYNATFIAVSNTLLGITDSDNDTQKAEKFKSWLSAEKEAGRAVKAWYPVNETQTVETVPITLTPQWGVATLTISGADGEPSPRIQATAVQDWTALKEEQQAKNQSYEERLDALEASITGG